MRLSRLGATLLLATAMLGSALVCAPAQAASSYRITLHHTPAKIAYGHSIRLGGKVSGGPARGRSVRIYGYYGDASGGDDRPRRVGTAKLSPHGYFHFYFRPPSGGDWQLEVRKSAVGHHAEADAQSDATAVYQWADMEHYESLGSDEEGPNGATISRGTAQVNGKSYKNATLVNDGASLYFTTFNNGCKLLRGAVGITSTSPRSAGTLTLTSDRFTGIQVNRQQEPTSFQLAISPTDGVTLSAHIGPHADGTDGGTANTVALIRPQLYCDAPRDAQGSF